MIVQWSLCLSRGLNTIVKFDSFERYRATDLVNSILRVGNIMKLLVCVSCTTDSSKCHAEHVKEVLSVADRLLGEFERDGGADQCIPRLAARPSRWTPTRTRHGLPPGCRTRYWIAVPQLFQVQRRDELRRSTSRVTGHYGNECVLCVWLTVSMYWSRGETGCGCVDWLVTVRVNWIGYYGTSLLVSGRRGNVAYWKRVIWVRDGKGANLGLLYRGKFFHHVCCRAQCINGYHCRPRTVAIVGWIYRQI